MIDQPGVAVRAGKAEAAGAAERERRIAAPVEEQQRLLAALERDLDRLGEPRRDIAAARRALAGQVDRFDDGQVLAAEPLRQLQAVVAAAPRIDLGLDRRRRRRQHHRELGDVPAHHRHVAGMVMHAVLLLVDRVVLLIDDDQAEVRIGQEQRRARPGDDADLAARHALPGAGAQARAQLRMPFRRAHAESRGEAIEGLRGERDFRHQDQSSGARVRSLRRPPRNRPRSCPSRSPRRAASPNSRRFAPARATPRRPRPAPARSRARRSPGRAGRTMSGGSGIASSVPSSISPSITPTDTPASRAASPLPRARPSASSASTRARAAVIRCGAGPARRTPTRTRSGPRCSPMRNAMRSTMPRGLSV